MDKKYQVFVSSTYADLREERRAVIETLMQMPCIPVGMEIFPASDQSQLDYIKRIIDNCDYYLLVIGGRYGSVTADGISFTESEYHYAMEKKKTVVALLHKTPGSIAFDKSEADPALRQRLDNFRKTVSKDRLVRHWETVGDLQANVALSMTHAISNFPAIGWVRADRAASEDVLSDINTLRKEKEQLAAELATLNALRQPISDLAGVDEPFSIICSYVDRATGRVTGKRVELTWKQIFAMLAPLLQSMPNEIGVRRYLTKRLVSAEKTSEIAEESFDTITIQFQALGLVERQHLPTAATVVSPAGWAMFWKLTPLGQRRAIEYRAVRAPQPSSGTAS
jgi:Domain of unknown function (DUF4062)